MAGNMKIALPEKIALLLHPHVDVRGVWLLRNLTLDDKLCLRYEKKCCLCITLPSLAMADEHGKRHARRVHQAEAVSDWLNPFSLGTMSASAYVDNLA